MLFVIFCTGVSLTTSVLFSQEKTAGETPKIEESIEEFNETRFLILDRLYIPNELQVIDDQILQNATDVIILSGTHSIVYNTQLDPKGVSKEYKNFHGLRIEIIPIENKETFYSLRLFYYNWITKKYDKRFFKEISKFNVLNELRFSLYQLFKGKSFVEQNSENIEKSNYERIQAIAKTIEERKIKKKNEEKKKKKEQEKQLLEEAEKEKQQLLKREEDAKKNKKKELQPPTPPATPPSTPAALPADIQASNEESSGDPVKKNNLKDDDSPRARSKKSPTKANPEAVIPPPAEQETTANPTAPNVEAEKMIPRESELYFLGGLSADYADTQGLLNVKTNLRYLTFGARYLNVQQIEKPTGYVISMRAGMPIIKESYALPVLREIKSEYFKRDLIPTLRLGAGLDYSPIYFVNLPELGQGLQVFENDLLWVKFCLTERLEFYGKIFEMQLQYLTSLTAQSNFDKKMSASKLVGSFYFQITEKHGLGMDFQKTSISGDVTGSTSGFSASYSYFFGG